MTDVLTSRDGLISNSPRYAGYLSPPYQKYLKDDSGAAINLTGVATGAFGITMVNQSNPLLVKSGGGTWTILNATQGLVSYQYAASDLATPGNWYLFVTVKIPGETSTRAFDPDFLQIIMPAGGIPIVTVQQVDLEQLLGTPISTANPVPISGPISIPDGANVAQGATTDSSSASTQIGLLKAIKAYLAGTLTTAGTTTETNSAALLSSVGSPSDGTWSGTGNGSEIAILKKLVAELAATLNVQQTDLSVTGTISAAQPVINTPVSNASVTLAVGQGQSSFKVQLLAGTGGFTSGTTIVVDGSPDGGTTWYSKSFKVSGVTPNNPQSSVTGPGPLELSGNAASLTHIKVRCSVLNSTETINVRIEASAGVSDVGLLGSLPSGQNLVGGVNLVDSAGTNKQSINSAGQAQVEDIEQSGYIALTTPPATTNAGSDTTLTFSSQVNRVIIANNTNVNVNYDFDQAASAGSFLIGPGSEIVYPKKVTAVHLLTAAAQNINGTSAGNIIVRGAL